MIATDYVILRGVRADAKIKIPLSRRPKRIATILDEAEFDRSNGAMVHNSSIFLEDRFHDWIYDDGRLSYYSRIALVADVLVVFEFTN